ncbi:MAG: RNA pyrophosphohydrolase [Alphaproteobacteria bacterium]|nr:RNA pyrophosphohydrolase [Alphaproteobacteria bacterium]
MKIYRKCAGIIVFNQNKKVLVCARNDAVGYNWQFPQGGIEQHETPLKAAIRELKEETSIVSVKPVESLTQGIKYDFPLEVLKQAKGIGKKYAGQEIYWNLLYFFGSDDEINLNTKEPEFKAFEWVEPNEAVNRIVDFKKQVYQQAINMLSLKICEFSI